MKNEMFVIGHRGAMGYEPENTLASFRKALELGIPFVELDVYFVDGHLVVFHDRRLERTTNGQGLLIEQNFTHLRTLDAGKGEKIPTLPEVFAVVGDRTGLNIELKGPDTVEPVVDFISSQQQMSRPKEQFLVSSFKREILIRARQLDPRILLGVLVNGPLQDHMDFASELKAYAIHLPLSEVDEPMVKEAHNQGLKVFVYTVNEIADLEKMNETGVDGVFSDYPDRVAGSRTFKETPGWL